MTVIILMTAGDALSLWFRQGLFWAGYVIVGAVDFPKDVDTTINMQYLGSAILHSITVTTYAAIFAVKLSYLLFFRKLIGPVRHLTVWWWVVLAILIPACAM